METVTGPVDAIVAVPGSKSISNRALVCAALADGVSVLENLAPGDDTAAMLEALRALGVPCVETHVGVEIHGCSAVLRGGGTVDARLAGTTSRFLTALCSLADEPTTVTGGEPLRRRPMFDLHRALLDLGASVRPLESEGHLPVTVHRESISGGRISLRGDVSSQFLSALMLIGPYLDGGLHIDLTSKLVSRPYVELTKRVMSAFGASEITISEDAVEIPPGRYRATRYSVEPDASSASYPLAAAAIVGGRVLVTGLRKNSLQGDIRILEILESMGCSIEEESEGTGIGRSGELRGVDIDMEDVSDLVPTIAAVAVFANSPTRIRNVGFIRAKESNRIDDLVAGINRIGVEAVGHPDGLTIVPSSIGSDVAAVLSAHHDHRLAMAWSLIALRKEGISVDDPSVVAKSWPNWWDVRDVIRRSSIK